MFHGDLRKSVRQNYVLRALTDRALSELGDDLQLVDLALGDTLYTEHVLHSHVYFPVSGVISYIGVLRNGSTAEVGLVGREGVVGLGALLGGLASTGRAIVQADGQAWALPMGLARSRVRSIPRFRTVLARSAQVLIAQIMQTAMCNRHHKVEQQLSRWILEMMDRTGTNELKLTQHLMAEMLGVRREIVSLTASGLKRIGAIEYSRGRLTVINRRILETKSCECYRAIIDETSRLLREDGDCGDLFGASRRNPLAARHG
jgi:CRP-like cAMP-binding protein